MHNQQKSIEMAIAQNKTGSSTRSSGNSITPAINFQQGSSPSQSSGRQGILKLTVTKQAFWGR
ncbi:MAG: hypothetical protein EAZ09_06145 [Oscillatoriales cyanobacterium]|nr:MAG: hypothetical protein EAZ18_05380 [Oscillatoriales cyanobacterium]TAH23739.1 MAG: hypothetical protein EAZ09_06145 [Oscillatoriales cyanobacterium]